MAVGRSAICSGNVFCKDLESASTAQPPSDPGVFPFVRIPIVVGCTVTVFVLFVAGTAATAISYPPAPSDIAGTSARRATALDGDLKLLGPLLLTAGCFLLVVDVALCALVSRAAYRLTKAVAPRPPRPVPVPLAVAGGPFYIVTTDPIVAQPLYGGWGHRAPDAPSLDSSPRGRGEKSRAAAVAIGGPQPPFNPDAPQPTRGDP